MVKETLESDAQVQDPEAVAKEVQRIYGWRSDLVHDGRVEDTKLETGISRLTEVVPRVLSVLFVRAAGSA